MKKVLLVHGAFHSDAEMFPLSKRLQKRGYTVEIFSYPFYPNDEDITRKFVEYVARFQPEGIIGHSLGGVIAVHNLTHLTKSVERVVCLGSPLAGLLLAKEVSVSFASFLVSPSIQNLLVQGATVPHTTIQIGMVAGTQGGIGFDMLWKVLKNKHDGAIQIKETKIPGLTDHIEVPVGHANLIYSEMVVGQTVHFLENGVFEING